MDKTDKATPLLEDTIKKEGKEEFSVNEVETISPISYF